MVRDSTLYDRLELPPNAPEDEIKRKGKKLLIKWHPDKNPDNVEESTKKFQEIQEALKVLENSESRQLYDQHGMDFLKGGGQQDPFQGGFPGGFPPGFPFGNFFGGGPPGGQREEKKENVVERLDVTLEQLYKEETVEVKYNHNVCCVKCAGEGTNDGSKTECRDCNGQGVKIQVIRMGPMIQQVVGPCNVCRGKGKVIPDKNRCDMCHGNGFVSKETSLHLPLKNGLTTGIKLQLEGKGHRLKNMKTDLLVVINVLPHTIFKCNGTDLIIEVSLKLYQALFGFDKVIQHLDGRQLHLHCTGKTEFGTIRKIVGEGMKDLRSGAKGDLVIKFNIQLPVITNETLIKALTLIDKPESVNEKTILTQSNLVKTMMVDVVSNTYSENKESNQSNQNQSNQQEESHQQQAQCAQQ